MIHEYGHLLALRALGYTGAISSEALNVVTSFDIASASLFELRVFFLSGGLFQCLIFLSLCLLNKDEENRLVNKMVAIQGLIYALFEGFLRPVWWELGGTIGIIVSFIFMAVVIVKSNPTL